MSVPAAYLGVILIWSTTPLAIQWSSAGWGYLFALSGRMLLGALVCALLLSVIRPGLVWHRAARHTYLITGISIYGAMMGVYWGAQYVPSGLIAVFYGLNPLLTGLMAAVLLRDDRLGWHKLAGVLLGIAGLLSIFASNIMLQPNAWLGVLSILFSVLIHSFSSVWIKRINSQLPGLVVTSGGLFIATPLFLLTWWFADGQWPTEMPAQSTLALVYLGIFGSALGFTLYYFLLGRLAASTVALITLVTPVLALMIGQWLNGELIPLKVWLGSALIVSGLMLHLWGERLPRLLASALRDTG
jgi:drug/metabolite transporter (DMT)-like permease